jgi:hypothetical protein
MNIFKLFSTATLVGIALFFIPGCSNEYYTAKTITNSSGYSAVITKAQKKHRYIMMQSGVNLYSVTLADVHKSRQEMTVTLDKVDSTRLTTFNSAVSSNTKLKKAGLVGEAMVRLYMTDSTSYTYDEPHTVPMNKISRVEVVD